jgi:hypothetical protein
MLRIYKILTLGIFVLLSFSYAFAQQYCVYQRDFNQWLCNNVRGAGQACYAPDYVGKFPDFNSCENARRSALPYDFRWQEMTRCVPCGPSEPLPQKPQYQQGSEQHNLEKKRLTEKIREEAIKEQVVREQHVKSLQQKKEQEFKNMVSELSSQMKTSHPPMNSIQREQYKKALEQAYCVAYTSLKAAEMAIQGEFEISKKLLTNLENMRASAEQVFDGNNNLASCPKPDFNIPDVKMSVERDLRYVKYNEITETVRALIPKIEANFKKLQTVQEKKKEAEKKRKEADTKIKELNEGRVKTKEDKEAGSLLAEALALKQQAETKYQEALQNEQKLLNEKLEIINKLNEMRNKMLANEEK